MESPQIMTLGKVIDTYEIEPIYIQEKATAAPMIALYSHQRYTYIYFYGAHGEKKYHGYSYGKSWRCWDGKPTIDYMNEVPW